MGVDDYLCLCILFHPDFCWSPIFQSALRAFLLLKDRVAPPLPSSSGGGRTPDLLSTPSYCMLIPLSRACPSTGEVFKNRKKAMRTIVLLSSVSYTHLTLPTILLV
eukprot:3924532-Pyramimonas_sp.AAC.1